MRQAKLFFENESAYTLYVVLRVDCGVMEIHLYDKPTHNSNVLEPNRVLAFKVNDTIETCIRDGRLNYLFKSHVTGQAQGKICFLPGKYRRTEGPVFSIEPAEMLN